MIFVELSPDSQYTSLTIGNKAKNLCIVSDLLGGSYIAKGFSIPAEEIETKSESQIASEFNEIMDKLNISFPILFRSSTSIEDSSLSFAGIFESYLCHKPDNIKNCIKAMKAMATSTKVQMYCKLKRIDLSHVRLSILIQEYLPVDVSGVAFTKHPLTSENSSIYIEYFPNTSDGIESGKVHPLTQLIKKKSIQSNEQFETLRLIANRLENHFGYPLDIEWAFQLNRLYIFQVRPITV